MDISGFELLSLSLLGSAIVSIVAIILWARLSSDPDQSIRNMLAQHQTRTVFLFDGGDLVDCTPPARLIFVEMAKGGPDYDRLARGLAARYPGIPSLTALVQKGPHFECKAVAGADTSRLVIDSWAGFVRITLTDVPRVDDLGLDDVTLAHQGAELSTLRSVTNSAPFLIWQLSPTGEIDWANEAYLQMVQHLGVTKGVTWPPRALFDARALPDPDERTRISFDPEVGEPKWFDVDCVMQGGKHLFFAAAADSQMQAEVAQRSFVQTLTKTFAHLSIGLAIFDRSRQLALFNPALLDLMPLPIEYLSQRPTLQRFLDRLREEKMIAEPKDYYVWRKHISELEAQAAAGTYCETWPLPGGLTFRVTGRPHPDGAIAFLFEDISSEVSLTRRFHSQIALGREVVDAMDEAVAVFTDSGVLALTNQSYRDLWNTDPEGDLADQTLPETVGQWRSATEPDPMWDALLAASQSRESEAVWYGEMTLRDGRRLKTRMTRLSGRMILIGFQTSAPLAQVANLLAERRKALAS